MGRAAPRRKPRKFNHGWDSDMAFTPGQQNAALNGTTYVDVVAAPASSTQRVVKNVCIYNADTVANEITLALDDNGTVRLLFKETLQAGESYVYDAVRVLTATTMKLKAKMTGAVTSTNPDVVASFADAT
jgi:hypothetical protein